MEWILALVLLGAPQVSVDLGALRSACSAKDAGACDRLAAAYRSGRGAPRDPARAAAAETRARNLREPDRRKRCADCEAACSGPDASDERCEATCTRAGSPPGACLSWVARLEIGGGDGNPVLQGACDRGDGVCCAMLATRYQTGHRVARSPERASALMRKGCELHEPASCGMWGLVLVSGQGRPKDEPAGAAALGESCEDGYPPGCEYLGDAYRLGAGVPRDIEEAAAHYRRACDGYVVEACYKLGNLYQGENGLRQDKSQALAFFRLACGGGMDAACARVKDLQSTNPVDIELQAGAERARRIDQAMQPYIQQARKSYPAARARYLAGLPGGQTFYVTVRLRDSAGRFEQVFLRVTEISRGKLSGKIQSQIGIVSGYRLGQTVVMAESEVLDWTIVHPDGSEEGNVVGKFLDTYKPE